MTQLIKCELKENGFIRFSNQLSNKLGFRQQSVQQRINVALYLPDLFPGLNCIFVFPNIIEEQFVGHEKTPLLICVFLLTKGAHCDFGLTSLPFHSENC